MVSAYFVLLALVALERLVELAVSRRHAAWALARGGVEVGREHYDVMRLAHGLWLAGSALEVVLFERSFLPALGLSAFALVLGAQALRWWAVASLGRAWSTRAIVVPGARAVVSGPYRWVRHPNYVAVLVEGLALPLVHSAWVTALAFTALNLVILRARIRSEETALAEHTDWAERFRGCPRFIPRRVP